MTRPGRLASAIAARQWSMKARIFSAARARLQTASPRSRVRFARMGASPGGKGRPLVTHHLRLQRQQGQKAKVWRDVRLAGQRHIQPRDAQTGKIPA